VVFINQLREKVGIVFGNPEVTPGGRALKFYSSVRIDLRRADTIKQGNEVIGSHVKAKVVKNKVAPPFRTAEFDIMFDHGISREGNLVDLGVELGLVNKSGAFFSYGDLRLGQGRENAKQYLAQHVELAGELEQKIRASVGTSHRVSSTDSDESS
jgi:recombination protein RecA